MSSRAALLNDRIRRARDAGPDPESQRAAIAYYLARPRGDEVPGMPRLQSTDVADMVHAVLAQLLPTFAGDAVCQIEPDGPADDAQARLETDAVNRIIMEDGRGHIVLQAAIKDALLLKAGIVRVWVEETTSTITRRRRGATDEVLRLYQAEADPALDTVERDGDEIILTIGQRVRRVRIAPVDPLNWVVSPEHESAALEGCPLVAERWQATRGELVELGYDREQVGRVPTTEDADGTMPGEQVRRRAGMTPVQDQEWEGETVYCWRVYETAPDGAITYTLLGGQEVLDERPVAVIPYAAGTALPEPHQFWGLSLFDRLKSIQDGKTLALRQWVANLAAGNLPKTVINDNVEVEDLTAGRAVGVVRVQGVGPVAESIMPLPVMDLSGNAAAFLGYMDAARADRGGAALQMATGEAQLMAGQVGSMGVDRIFSVQEQMAALFARNLAETLLRSLFLLVHRTLADEYGEPMQLQLAGQWVTVDPTTWRPRSRVNIRQGLSPGERSRMVAGLTATVQAQLQLLTAGMSGVLVDVPALHRALLDLGRAQGLDGAPMYWIDPASPQSQQAQQAQAQQAQQAQQLQQQLAQIQLQLEQARVQLDQQRLALDAGKARQDDIYRYRELATNAEIEEAKLTATVTADLVAAQQQARAAADARERGGPTGPG